ncbi:MAG: PD40 domain-containing protein [Anaerolineae bacterium]|nr:PD40 domain-containing protein [Anaerolineae bacterium]
MRRLILLLTLTLMSLWVMPLAAQDALNLPADLYVLTNAGVVQRYGLGAEGISQITPADEYVVDFGVAPDGDLIAYRTETSINVMSMSGASDPRVIERQADVPPYRGLGESIAWSPDQRAVAYSTTYGARVYHDLGDVAAYSDLREGLFVDLNWSPSSQYLAARTDTGVWWIYQRLESAMSLASVITQTDGIAWVSGSQIVFTPPDGGLILMDLELANEQIPILDAQWEYHLPYLNASDELVFFGRDKTDESVPPGYGHLQSIARGAAEVITRGRTAVQTAGLRWAPGALLLTAFDAGVLALYDPVSGQGFPLPISDVTAYGWGKFDANAFFALQPTPQPIVPTPVSPESTSEAADETIEIVSGLQMRYDGFFLASDEGNRAQLWRLPADGTNAVQITFADNDVVEYAVAPDLSSAAYVSGGQLWLQRLSGGRPLALAALVNAGFVSPTFSPDSSRIAYTDGGIQMIGVDGQNALLVRADSAEDSVFYGEPKFSPDGMRLLVSELRPGTNGIHGVVTLGDGEYQRLQTDFGAQAFWLSDGSIVSYGYTPQGEAPGEQTIVRFTPGSLDAPEVIYTLSGEAVIETVIEGALGEIRLITRETESATPQMVDVAYGSGDQATITLLPPVVAPRLSYDGGFLAGYLNLTEINGVRQGPLTIFNAGTGQQVLLGHPLTVWAFQWAR